MPPKRRPGGRGKIAKGAQVKGKSSNPKAPTVTTHRPNTRAWARAQQETTGVGGAPAFSQAVAKQYPASRRTGILRDTKSETKPLVPKNVQSNKPRTRRNKARAARPKAAPVQVRSTSEVPREEHGPSGLSSPNPTQRLRLSPNAELSTWLRAQSVLLRDTPSPALDDSPLAIGSRERFESSMTTSSSVSGASHLQSEGASTPRPVANAKTAPKSLLDKLRTRHVATEARTPDEKTEHVKSLLGVQKTITIPFKDTKGLQTILTNFLQTCDKARSRDNSYTAIETLSNEINKWKPKFNLTTITNQDFDKDIAYCQRSNEAVLQRTVMLSIIDRWQLNDMFDFNCEGQWSLQGTYPLPSTQGPRDTVPGPRPDLAIFFRLDALVGKDLSSFSAPVPPKLRSCIWPDKYIQRCFPFVFIEAKKGFHDLTCAVYANMHSASQALLNIYKWMEIAGHTDIFFEDVRLFSIAINAEKIIARVHRAAPIPEEEGLVFLYDDLLTLYRYSRDEACVLIRNILVKYGVAELHGILKATFQEVSRQYKEGEYQDDQATKRKTDHMPQSPPKRARRSQNATQATSQQEIDPSTSFEASRIHISDD